ncbi:protein of unknown function [Marinobacter sp. DSM 26671]|nr:protein of unknown function [Marinobacter sp. DSM 26671]
MLLYDIMDTEGKPVPDNAFSFAAKGDVTQKNIARYIDLISKVGIHTEHFDAGDRKAGSIQRLGPSRRPFKDKGVFQFQINLNRNHDAPIQFATFIHELGHLFLGHLGDDKPLKIPSRTNVSHRQREIEAESVSYILCRRVGVSSRSQTYLSGFVEKNTTLEDIDIYQVMKAAGQVESLLKLQTHYSARPAYSSRV